MLLSDNLDRVLVSGDSDDRSCDRSCNVTRTASAGDGEWEDEDRIASESFVAMGNARPTGSSLETGDYTYNAQQAKGDSFPYDSDTKDADQAVDGLISGNVWDRADLTYSFPTDRSDYEADYINDAAVATVSGFSPLQKQTSRDALAQYAAISRLSFTQLGNDPDERAIDADLRLALSDDPATAYAYYPFSNPVGGDAFWDTASFDSPQPGNYQYYTFLHEIGHSLGLKHGHEGGGAGAVPFEMDSMEFSVMTYRSWVGKPLNYGPANETWGYAQSLMMLDIAAIQQLYGANFTSNAGDTTYSFSTNTGELFVNGVGAGTPGGNRVFRTLWDGNGTDTYDFSNYATDLAIDLAPGSFTDLDTGGNFQRAQLDFGYQDNPVTYARGHVFNALQFEGDDRSLIENAVGGSGDDRFRGNSADNTFTGQQGDDTFYDSDGSDTYRGGAGDDLLVLDGTFASYSFALLDEFLQIADDVVDWVEDTIEAIEFADVTKALDDIVNSLLQPENTAPVAANDSANTDAGMPVVIEVLANDSDADRDGLSISSFTQGANGSVTLAPNGTFSYTPEAGFVGTDSFTYVVSDGDLTDTASVDVLVQKTPQAQPNVEIGLYNTKKDRLIATLRDGDAVNSSRMPNRHLTLVAALPAGSPIAGEVESVRLNLNGQTIRTADVEPYALFGSNGSDLISGSIFQGEHEIAWELFSEDGANGQLLGSGATRFTIL